MHRSRVAGVLVPALCLVVARADTIGVGSVPAMRRSCEVR